MTENVDGTAVRCPTPFPGPGGSTDSTIKRLGYSFNALGLPFQQTSYNDTAGTQVANQVEELYNGFGQLTNEYQAHSGAVNTSTTPEVQYGYSTNDNNSRLTSETYPNWRVLDYNYTSTLDNAISRIDQIYNAAGSYIGPDQSYLYLGLNTIVQATDGNGVALSYIQQPNETNVLTSGGDRYTGLDEFGRVIDQNWVNLSTGVSTDRFQYGYDRNSNVLYKNNLLDPAMSELYHANSSSSGDNNTAYDPLNRLRYFSRGTLSASNNNGSGGLDTILSPSSTNSWTYDAVSNITSSQSGGSRTLNAQNQITNQSGQPYTSYYDNGNVVGDPAGDRAQYDAWNRLVLAAFLPPGASYSYDALGRRIYDGSSSLDLYYDSSGNVVEQQQGGYAVGQFVWGLGHPNDLVAMQYGQGGSVYYAQQDVNWSVTSLTDASGNVTQRMIYDPYGSETFLTPSWGAGGNNATLAYGFQGGRVDGLSGLIHIGTRDYNPALGVWMEAEPSEASYVDGMNLYESLGDNPVSFVDPSGRAYQDPTDPYGGIADLTNNNPAYSHGLVNDPTAAIRNWNNNMNYLRNRAADAARAAGRNVWNMARAWGNEAYGTSDPCPDAQAHKVAKRINWVFMILGAIEGGGSLKQAAKKARSTILQAIKKALRSGSYPEGVPKPSGTFDYLEGDAYTAARKAANRANSAAHKTDPSLAGKHIHEITPVKFGGSPTDPANKVPLDPDTHYTVTNWWNQIQRTIDPREP